MTQKTQKTTTAMTSPTRVPRGRPSFSLVDQYGGPVRLSRQAPAYSRAVNQSKSDVRETWKDTHDGFTIEASQNCDDTIQAVHDAASILKKRSKGATQYIGSAPLIVAQIWAKECGAPVGSREFSEYARQKMMSGEFAKLKVHF